MKATEAGERGAPIGRTVPRAADRLQLRLSFGFAAAAAVAPYLERLGVSHVYTSPILQAAPESEHAYDVVDPHRINNELGGDAAHRAFNRRLGRHHLGQVIDIVPNHMAIPGAENMWWWDGGSRLHVRADRPRESPRMGCGPRGRRHGRLE